MILLNDFQKQWQTLSQATHAAVDRVGSSGWYILGKEVEAFETKLAQAFGVRFAIGVANGLDAIEIALRALDLKPGDRVLTTPLSAFATTLAILRAGGVPEYVDVDEFGMMDLVQAEERLAHAKGEIRFLLPVHLYGHCLDLDRLDALARRSGVKVIEDCAQSILASHQGAPGAPARRAGSAGSMAATSFYPTKNLGALGDAGAVLTNDPGLAAQAKKLRNYGQSERYRHETMGLNSRLDELQAAILAGHLAHLEGWTARRRAIADRYRAGISHPRLKVLPRPPKSGSVEHLFPLLVDDAALRPGLLKHLEAQGVQAGVHYPILIPDQPAMHSAFPNRTPQVLSRARAFSTRELSIPIHPFLSDAEVDSVIAACLSWKP